MSSDVNQKQTGDVAIDEINYYLKQYEDRRDGFRGNHKLTRRLSILSVFWAVLSLAILFSDAVLKVDLVKLNPYQFVGFDVVNWHLIIFWPTVIVFLLWWFLSTYKEVIGNLNPIIPHYINNLSVDNFPVST